MLVERSRNDVFFDTNIIVYFTSEHGLKAKQSASLLAGSGVVSVQLLNEVANVMCRKTPRTWAEIAGFFAGIRRSANIIPITVEIQERAQAERYQLNIFDANIVAAAVLAGCTTLFSEDMHNGMVIDGLTIRNPYNG